MFIGCADFTNAEALSLAVPSDCENESSRIQFGYAKYKNSCAIASEMQVSHEVW
jgi:hypothetical protein